MLCWRVQGLGPRAHIPRGPNSFVLLNRLLGAGRGRKRKYIPLETPPQNLIMRGEGEGVQMETRSRACLVSRYVGDSQKLLSRKLKN